MSHFVNSVPEMYTTQRITNQLSFVYIVAKSSINRQSPIFSSVTKNMFLYNEFLMKSKKCKCIKVNSEYN